MTMLVAFLLLGLKVGEVMRDGRRLALSFSEAQAQSEGAKDQAKPAADAKNPEKKAGDKTEGEPKVNPPSTQSDEDAQGEPKHEYSQVEVDLLQSLAKRRLELDDWAKQVQLKENMLVATEQRINGKIDSLQKVKKQVEDLLAQYNQQEDTKIRSLVKIYENMKPKDAARIFEELDMPVLLMVVDRMSERKVAPVLAAMSPTKAKDVTVQLAEQRKLQKARGGNPVMPPPDAGSAAAPDAASSSADSQVGSNPAPGAPAASNNAPSPPASSGSR
jgi:flagellar motility protein MotE (MotC chaperone)